MRSKNLNLLTRMATLRVSNNELAARARVSPVTISLTLNQRTDPKPETRQRIAAALDCKPSDLWPEVQP